MAESRGNPGYHGNPGGANFKTDMISPYLTL